LWFKASLGKKKKLKRKGKRFTRLHHNKWLGMVVHSCFHSYTGKHKQEDHHPGQPRHKATNTERVSGVVQVLVHLSNKHEALNSTSSMKKGGGRRGGGRGGGGAGGGGGGREGGKGKGERRMEGEGEEDKEKRRKGRRGGGRERKEGRKEGRKNEL
jgi:uncharacterized membrane protein YgcG